jgi:hypothetical protein
MITVVTSKTPKTEATLWPVLVPLFLGRCGLWGHNQRLSRLEDLFGNRERELIVRPIMQLRRAGDFFALPKPERCPWLLRFNIYCVPMSQKMQSQAIDGNSFFYKPGFGAG